MDFDCVVIGAGVVGLACAMESARKGLSTIVVERHDSFGQETSSRNSEVVHSGIYYPAGSLKTRLCIAGNKSLYDFSVQHDIWHRRCGKIIVAVTDAEEPELRQLYQRGLDNGVEGMKDVDSAGVEKLEPNIRCRRAIFVPSTGIIDSHELMRAYLALARDFGTVFGFNIEFLGGKRSASEFELTFSDYAGEKTQLRCRYVINAAGLCSDRVAQSFGIDPDEAGYRLHLNRGHYYHVSPVKSSLVSRLVYPIPYKHLVGAGIHITIDRAGQLKLGPDNEYLEERTPEEAYYRFDDTRREKFFTAVRPYFPCLEISDLEPGQVGVRPKLKGSDSGVKDFIIREESQRGLPGLLSLIGIESPGLTCSLEIGKYAVQLLTST